MREADGRLYHLGALRRTEHLDVLPGRQTEIHHIGLPVLAVYGKDLFAAENPAVKSALRRISVG